MTHVAFIGLGSNLQEPHGQIRSAFAAIASLHGTRLLEKSSLYRSAPMGCTDQPDFVNAVVKIETDLSPRNLLQKLLQIEHDHGRERSYQNAPRTLDLDVLLYDDLRLREDGLTIPHPQMHLRAFVLRPLLEITAEIHIPGVGSAREALDDCAEQVLEKLTDAV